MILSRNLGNHKQSWWVDAAPSSILWHPYCASELSSVSPEDTDATTIRSNKYVFVAWMNVKASNICRYDKLLEWGFR